MPERGPNGNPIGKNNQCYCGSTNKYKRCCRNSDNSTVPLLNSNELSHKLEQKLRATHNQESCYHPDAPYGCGDRIVRAHSISKSMHLRPISHLGEVTQISLGKRYDKNKTSNGLVIKNIGLRVASTFNGFCNKHDKDLFAPLEDKPFIPTSEQIALLHYRTLARELHSKISASKLKEDIISIHPEPLNRFSKRHASWKNLMDNLDAFCIPNHIGAIEINGELNEIAQMISGNIQNTLRSIIFKVDGELPCSFSGNFTPRHSPDGAFIQSLLTGTDENAAISLHTHHENSISWIIITWIERNHNLLAPVTQYFLDHYEECVDLLVEYAVCNIENVFFNPLWTKSLNNDQEETLCRWIRTNTESQKPILSYGDYGSSKLDFPKIKTVLSTTC